MACCWYGEVMCGSAKGAATVIKPVSELRKLKLERSVYWSDKKLIEVYGEIPDFKEEYEKQVKQ